MSNQETTYVFLPGSGGISPQLAVLKSGPEDKTRFATISYPGWKRYVRADFNSQVLIEELAADVEKVVPQGPIRIMGHSMGGHFGYAVALHLKARGREIAGFCAIDSFMINTAAATAGWQGRAFSEAIELVRRGQVIGLVQFVSSRFWRAALRLGGSRIASLLNVVSSSRWIAPLLALNPTLERELSLRLLVKEVAPWLPLLDVNPCPLNAPAILIRTPATAEADPTWCQRCPQLEIYEVEGNHHTLFDPENAAPLREAFLKGTAKWQSRMDMKAA